MPKPIIIVEGGQYGSEAKGAVAAFLCKERNVDYAVRTGAINAGHTVYYEGKEYKMQQLPTGWVNSTTVCVLGPGALINPITLFEESEKCGVQRRLLIDRNCGLHLDTHTKRAQTSGRHHNIGATGKGCSEALCDRIRLRGKGGELFRDYISYLNPEIDWPWMQICDTTQVLNDGYDNGAQILLEGTQGSLLDLYLGPYPYTTHKPTQASTWIQECGLSPRLDYEVVLVVRTYPIRVAGNSGPMPREIDWVELALRINADLMNHKMPGRVKPGSLVKFVEACMAAAGKHHLPRNITSGLLDFDFHRWVGEKRNEYKVAISELHRDALSLLDDATIADLKQLFEFTTVTKKLRRIAEFDIGEVKRAITWNRPNYLVITFWNYRFPEIWSTTSFNQWPPHTLSSSLDAIAQLEKELGVPIKYISTGPLCENILKVSNATR